MKKEELERDNMLIREALNRTHSTNKELLKLNSDLKEKIFQLERETQILLERTKMLEGQLRMINLKEEASKRYTDDEKYY